MMFSNGSFNQELLMRRKLEEQAELQRAIELQARRFTGLRLNLNNISFSSSPASVNSPSITATQPIDSVDSSINGTNFCSSSSQEDTPNEGLFTSYTCSCFFFEMRGVVSSDDPCLLCR